MSTALPQRALLVDDHDNARAWLRGAVLSAFPGLAIEEASSVASARAALQAVPFDLALLDLGLPDGSGLEVLRELRRVHPDCQCVIATVFDDDEHVFAALKQGANGYLLKEQGREELALLLAELRQGRPPLSTSVARRLLSHFAAPAPVEDELPALTPRERDVLRMVAKGFSVKETANTLEISPHTAHGYVRDIYRKLAVSSRAEAALAASRMGLL